MKYTVIGIALLCLSLSACQTTTGIQSAVNIRAANYLNPDIDGSASPVMVSVYELKSPVEFSTASYQDLSNNAAQVLGTALVDKQFYEIQPGVNQTLTQTVTNNTRYLGVVAAYRNIDQANWRSVLAVPANHHHINININLESQNLYATLKG